MNKFKKIINDRYDYIFGHKIKCFYYAKYKLYLPEFIITDDDFDFDKVILLFVHHVESIDNEMDDIEILREELYVKKEENKITIPANTYILNDTFYNLFHNGRRFWTNKNKFSLYILPIKEDTIHNRICYYPIIKAIENYYIISDKSLVRMIEKIEKKKIIYNKNYFTKGSQIFEIKQKHRKKRINTGPKKS